MRGLPSAHHDVRHKPEAFFRIGAALVCAAAALACAKVTATPERFPDPARDIHAEAGSPPRMAVLAGGCFWGVEAVFERLDGVKDVVAGYAGGDRRTAHYEMVGTGRTGHAESVRITYDPSRITYGQLLKIFFAVAHDPTELNRQGPDEGPQYRSSIFYGNADEQAVATAYIHQLDAAHVFPRAIVTTVVPLEGFYPAEAYHQNFLDNHPHYPYIVYNDLPKLAHLKRAFPEMIK